MSMLIGIIVCVFLIILRELEKSDTRRILDKAKDMSFINKELESIQRKRQSNRELSMTREEEIREAIDKTFPCTNGGRCYEQSIGASGFELGVKWADKNPKSPWISTKDDLPCNHEELLINKGVTKKVIVLKFGGSPGVDFMLRVNGEWIWFAYENHKFWMPIPELPKE